MAAGGRPLRVAVVAEYYPRPSNPALGIWAHRQALAVGEHGVQVRVLALHRPVPPIGALRGGLGAVRDWGKAARSVPRATVLDADAHQRSDARDVDRLERAAVDDALLDVAAKELGLDVVAGEPERRLRQVVGSEAEEIGVRCDPVGDHARPGQLHHRADGVGEPRERQATRRSPTPSAR